jgi:hypothetical protein
MITNEAPNMTGKKTGFMGTSRGEMDKQNPKFYTELNCAIH